ncbi:hypothetical protein E2C01_014809 [Portunus trituberculatus]|uniref:Uncharacterized protein n=1 Tax=Portunus trituberculatus TaxID=210409 RepID=A0A5B7DJQ5_PORTR|nr:hypothetical protein [Portunus trituberculatus]
MAQLNRAAGTRRRLPALTTIAAPTRTPRGQLGDHLPYPLRECVWGDGGCRHLVIASFLRRKGKGPACVCVGEGGDFLLLLRRQQQQNCKITEVPRLHHAPVPCCPRPGSAGHQVTRGYSGNKPALPVVSRPGTPALRPKPIQLHSL